MNDVWDVREPWTCGPLYLGMHRDEFVEHVGFEGELTRSGDAENFHSDRYQLDVLWTPGMRLHSMLLCRQTPMTIMGQAVLGQTLREAVNRLSTVTPVVVGATVAGNPYLPDLCCALACHDPVKGYLDGPDQTVTEVEFECASLNHMDSERH